eukprot:jgi/Tetstr1/464881/TSEL_009618.t1
MSCDGTGAKGQQQPRRERLEVGTAKANPLLEPTLGKKPVMKLDALPQGSVLDRVKAFLPEMAAANDQLQQAMAVKPAEDFDIEQVDGSAEKYIEMDLSCGVVDLKDETAVLAAEQAIAAGTGPGPAHMEGDSSSDRDSDSEAEPGKAHRTPSTVLILHCKFDLQLRKRVLTLGTGPAVRGLLCQAVKRRQALPFIRTNHALDFLTTREHRPSLAAVWRINMHIRPAMYGQMQQMQQQLQAVQQQMSAGAAASIGAPLTTAQQAELARARQRGQRAAIAKQKLIKQKAALAAKRAKATEAAAAKAETAVGKKRKAGKSKKGDDDGEDEDDDTTGDEARPATATAADIQGIEAMDVSALAAMSPDDQLIEIQKRLVGVECVKEQKRLKRLLRNRVSAQQARERKKSYLSSLEDKSREQENDIQALQQKVQSLQQENTMLRQVVKNMRMKDK